MTEGQVYVWQAPGLNDIQLNFAAPTIETWTFTPTQWAVAPYGYY